MKPSEQASRRPARIRLVVGTALIIYCLAYLVWFLCWPLGRYPLLDSAENLNLARQIAEGTLPPTPFFRAMLYPAVLSLALRVGLSADWLPVLAGLFGVACHLGSTVFVYQISERGWRSPRAAFWAAALFGFNPVSVYFAVEPLDTTFALFLFLAGLNLLHSQVVRVGSGSSLRTPEVIRFAVGLSGVGAIWALAMLARPHYAIVLAGAPFLLVALLWRQPRLFLASAAAFVVTSGLLLGVGGLLQKRVTGQFRIMPTQGGYSLWAGNRPGANGRYFEQKIHLSTAEASEAENPARIESEVLYRQETGITGDINPDAEANFWRKKTLDTIKANPWDWCALMGRKVYFLLNNFEQYNNKTYPVQKGFSPWLSYNPLGWGVTLVLCTVGLLLVCRRDRLFQGGVVLISVAGLYAGGVLLFFVSDRFRLPLLPFLCVGAGSLGLISLPEVGQRISARILPATVGLLLASVLTFSRFFGVHDLTPAVQDYVALSIAYGKAGDDLESLRWARKALAVRRDHPGALASAVNAFYNCNLRGIDPGNVFSDESWQLQVSRAGQIAAPPVSIRLVTAVALWKVSRPAEARLMLRGMLEAPVPSKALNRNAADDALGVLLLSGLHDSTDEADARARAADTRSFYLLAALARRETAAQPLIPPGRRNTVAELAPFVAQLFPEVRPSG